VGCTAESFKTGDVSHRLARELVLFSALHKLAHKCPRAAILEVIVAHYYTHIYSCNTSYSQGQKAQGISEPVMPMLVKGKRGLGAD
jgi:hypothetical protein